MKIKSYHQKTSRGITQLVTDYTGIKEYELFLLERIELKNNFQPSELSDEQLISLKKEYESEIRWNKTARQNLPELYDELTKRKL